MATTTMSWGDLIKAVEIDVVDSAPDAKVVEATMLMMQMLQLLRPAMAIGVTSAVLPTAVSVICVCIARAMTRGLKQTSSGSSTPTAPNMPRGAAEHADVLENSYVTATVDSAWSAIMDRQRVARNAHTRIAWANSRLLSLAKIKQHIMKETHEPVTLEALLHAEPPRTKHQKRSWSSNVASISCCIAAYHHAISSSEHHSCRAIQQEICAYAYTLRRGLPSNVDVTEFFALLHRAIMNRALNMALRKTIDKSLGDDLFVGSDGRCVTQLGRQALADILEQCIDKVLTDYQSLRDDIKQFRR